MQKPIKTQTMKKLIYIMLIIPNLFFAQIRAKLVDYDASKTPAYCSNQKSYGVLKFELQEKNRQKGEVAFILQECPRELMEKVGQYKNDSIYFVTFGNKVDKKLIKIAKKICQKDYPKDDTNIFWFGFINIDYR